MATATRPSHTAQGERWRDHRVASWLLRALIFLAPLAAAVGASLWLSPRLYEPTSAIGIVGWWAILIGASSLVAWGVDRLARRLLPLTVMLRMTLLFPDQAPPRYRVALRNSNTSELRRRVAEAEAGETTDLSAAAELILSLAAALNDHDRLTRGHGERTRAYADMLAEEMKVDREGRDKLRWAALLHDIGKLDVPAEILNKDGPLTDEEMALVRRHPLMGMRVAAALVPWLGEWAGAIEHHHERWDGTGYPRGLEGEEISLAARIVSVADAYDVMTSGRSYQTAKSPEEARQEIARMAGTQFDPQVVRALMSISLGRLRWMVGPFAGLGQIPFYLDRLGRDFITVTSAATVTAAAVVGGVVPLPALVAESLPALTAVVEERFPEDDPSATGNEAGDDSHSVQAPGATPLVPGDDAEASSTTVPTDDVVPGTETTTTVPPSTTPDTTAPPGTTSPTTPPTSPTTTAPPTSPTTTAPPTSPTTTAPTTTAPPTTTPPPSLHSDVASTPEDTPIVIDVLANDTPSGLVIRALSPSPASGSASITSNRIRYVPAPNHSGTVTFGYRACDSFSRCAESTVAVRIEPVNDSPTARNDSASVDAGKSVSINVLANDSDPDGDQLTVTSVGSSDKGVATTSGSAVTYTARPGTSGTDSFTYRVCDPGGACAQATVTVTIRAVQRPPNAVDDTATYHPGGRQGSVDVLANDTHPDGVAFDMSSLRVLSGPTNGEITGISGGAISYVMDRGNHGNDSFVYRICDVRGLCDTATVTLIKQP